MGEMKKSSFALPWCNHGTNPRPGTQILKAEITALLKKWQAANVNLAVALHWLGTSIGR